MNEETIRDIIKIARSLLLTKDDLIIEAETLEEYGEYNHIQLIGYTPSDLRDAADELDYSAIGK